MKSTPARQDRPRDRDPVAEPTRFPGSAVYRLRGLALLALLLLGVALFVQLVRGVIGWGEAFDPAAPASVAIPETGDQPPDTPLDAPAPLDGHELPAATSLAPPAPAPPSAPVALAPLPEFVAPTPDERLAAARAAGDYLLRGLTPDGDFTYLYNPITDHAPRRYNWLRHAGTVYSLCQLHAATGDARYLAAAESATAALRRTIVPLAINGAPPLTVQIADPALTGDDPVVGPTVKAGGVALAMVALLAVDRRTGRADHADEAGRLAAYLRWARDADGIPRSKFIVRQQTFEDWESGYYPGQCLLALAMFLADHPDHPDADANRAAMRRLLAQLVARLDAANREGGSEPRAFDHWALIGFAAAYPLVAAQDVSNDALLGLATRYADEEWRRQIRTGKGLVNGGFQPHIGKLTPASIRLEGIQAVAGLVRATPGPAAAACRPTVDAWEPALGLSHRYILGFQYPPPRQATGAQLDVGGAFANILPRVSMDDYDVQIDYCQHAISALLGDRDWQPAANPAPATTP